MRKAFLAVCSAAVLFGTGCASHPAPQPLRYAIVTPTEVVASDALTDIDNLRALRAGAPNDLLWCERNGGEYRVRDAAPVARATKAARKSESAALRRYTPWPPSSIVHYDTNSSYGSSTAAPP